MDAHLFPASKAVSKFVASESGFSVIEILLVLSLITSITFISISSSQTMFAHNKQAVITQALTNDILLARSEARTRRNVVRLCESSDQQSCTGNTRWDQGWIVFIDNNDNRRRDDLESVLSARHYTRPPAVIDTNVSTLKISSNGNISVSGRIEVCQEDKQTDTTTAIVFTTQGHLRTNNYTTAEIRQSGLRPTRQQACWSPATS